MLQTLLDERTHFPVYELLTAKRGPKLRESSTQKLRQADIGRYQGSVPPQLQPWPGGATVFYAGTLPMAVSRFGPHYR